MPAFGQFAASDPHLPANRSVGVGNDDANAGDLFAPPDFQGASDLRAVTLDAFDRKVVTLRAPDIETCQSGRRSGQTKTSIIGDPCGCLLTALISLAVSSRFAFAGDPDTDRHLRQLRFNRRIVDAFNYENAADGRAANRFDLQAAYVRVVHFKPHLFAVVLGALPPPIRQTHLILSRC